MTTSTLSEVLKQMVDVLEYWDVHGGVHQPTEEAIEAGKRAIAELESQQEQPKQVNELHTCPYREDIHGDYITLCDCDEESTYQCAQDI